MEHRDIARGMQVLTSDGEVIGTVDRPSNEGFMLRRMAGDHEERIPDMWVHRVDEQVHLNRTGAEAIAGWKSMQFRTSTGEHPATSEHREDDRRTGGTAWLLWLVAAAVAVLAILVLTGQLAIG